MASLCVRERERQREREGVQWEEKEMGFGFGLGYGVYEDFPVVELVALLLALDLALAPCGVKKWPKSTVFF